MFLILLLSDKKMEKLSELSKLTIAPITTVHSIPQTEVGCRDRHRSRIDPLTSVEPGKSTFSFQVPPCIPNEILLRDCYLWVQFKIRKNGGPYAATDQISCVQLPGVLFFESLR